MRFITIIPLSAWVALIGAALTWWLFGFKAALVFIVVCMFALVR